MNYSIVVEQTSDGSYWAYVPDLPTCATAGATREDVMIRIQEAIDCYAEEMADMSQPMPEPNGPVG